MYSDIGSAGNFHPLGSAAGWYQTQNGGEGGQENHSGLPTESSRITEWDFPSDDEHKRWQTGRGVYIFQMQYRNPALFRPQNIDSVLDELSPAEITLLKELADKGAPVSEARLDADSLRTLMMRRYIKRMSGFSVITPDGRRALESIQRGQTPAAAPPLRHRDIFPITPAPQAVDEEEEAPDTTVNSTQEDMLRQLALAEQPVPFDDLDGRVVRALEGRGLVQKAGGLVSLTDAGRAFYESKVRRRRRARSGWVKSQAVPAEGTEDRRSRAQSIRDAVDALQRAIGGADELEIGDLPAVADDAFAGLLELADRIERGADPRRIKRG